MEIETAFEELESLGLTLVNRMKLAQLFNEDELSISSKYERIFVDKDFVIKNQSKYYCIQNGDELKSGLNYEDIILLCTREMGKDRKHELRIYVP